MQKRNTFDAKKREISNPLSKNLKIRASRIQCQQSFPRILYGIHIDVRSQTGVQQKTRDLSHTKEGIKNRRGGEVLIHLLYFCLKSKLCTVCSILDVVEL